MDKAAALERDGRWYSDDVRPSASSQSLNKAICSSCDLSKCEGLLVQKLLS